MIDCKKILSEFNSVIDTAVGYVCATDLSENDKEDLCKILNDYYSCDTNFSRSESAGNFPVLDIAHEPCFKEHHNQYHILQLDVKKILLSNERNFEDIRDAVENYVLDDLVSCFPNSGISKEDYLSTALYKVVKRTGRQFVFILDNYDYALSMAKNKFERSRYLSLLDSVFNSTFEANLALALIIGTLPIEKVVTEDAFENFMLR